jgi:hypothetical protein
MFENLLPLVSALFANIRRNMGNEGWQFGACSVAVRWLPMKRIKNSSERVFDPVSGEAG